MNCVLMNRPGATGTLIHFLAGALLLVLGIRLVPAAETFRVATYNLESYLETAQGTRAAKSVEAKAKIREALGALRAEVVALQEIGDLRALLELRDSLRSEGLDYPHWEFVSGWDTNIHVAVLSQFPFLARRPHTNENFLLFGRRFRVNRGFAELDIRVNARYTITLITAHLKSRRAVPQADEADLREQEALLLREKIDTLLNARPNANLIVLGDFNDTPDSRSTKGIIGRGQQALIDTRPAERNGDSQPNPVPYFPPRNITWTHYYGKADTYSRIDYLLISKGLAREWDRQGTYVLSVPNWGVGSDHRPIVASFIAADR